MIGHREHRRQPPRADRSAAALLVVLAAGLLLVPGASAGSARSEVPVQPTAEAWYQPNPSCATPAGCVAGIAPPPANPYPAGTMHVGLSAARETARAYLAVPFDTVSGTITAAVLTVPLDTAPADGASASETARVQVCLTSAAVARVEGSFDQPPAVDCSVSAPASYAAAPQPHLEADLASLVAHLPTATGLALLPDSAAASSSDAWRVVFSAHDRADAARTAPATLALQIESEPAASLEDMPTPLPLEDAGGAFVDVAPPVGTGFAAPPAQVAAPDLGAPVVPAGAAPVTPTRIVTFGYAYPIVWLLPLILLVLIPTVGQALTRDLVPRRR